MRREFIATAPKMQQRRLRQAPTALYLPAGRAHGGGAAPVVSVGRSIPVGRGALPGCEQGRIVRP